jgi:gamma-glutamyltranspeptidase/glutathione hydrolase
MVTTAHPLATVAGVRMLEKGGNAADAALAAAFAVAVVRPSMNSIGGRNQILIRTPDGGFHGIDGTTQVPLGYDPATAPEADFGYATVGVPGALAGLMRLHAQHGSLPLDVLMEPAIEYAEQGFRLLPQQADFHARSRDELAESEGARMYYLKPDGSAYGEGELLIQRDLGTTLRRLVTGGHDLFYRGEMAEIMVADMEANGGFVNRESLESYEALDARIVRGSYRGHDLAALDVPAAGAVSIHALQIMETFDPASMDDDEWAAVIGQAVALAAPQRRLLGTDSAAARVTSKAWAAEQAKKIRLPANVERDTPSAEPFPSDWREAHHTTHLSTADSTGMAVALTQTIGPAMGSKVAVPGLGFLYASTLGGYLGDDLQPGFRARSSISPLMVSRGGELHLVLGAAGGARIVSSVVQVVSRVVDDGMSLPEALAAARVHPQSPGTLEMEMSAGWLDDDVSGVQDLGLEVIEIAETAEFGRVQAIRYHPAIAQFEGASDPDSEGTARGPSR